LSEATPNHKRSQPSATFSHAGYPVDTLMLEIHIASLSHSTKRITIHKHPTMNGLEESLIDKW